jgi:L-fuculose-phosphate aldolase
MHKRVIKELKTLAKAAAKHCIGMEGNISGKVDSSSFLIKASGHSLQDLEDTDLITYNHSNTQLDNFSKKGSMELGFHTFLLGFTTVKYIAHTHPANTLSILCTERASDFANSRLFPDQVVFNGSKTCLVPYAKPGEELTELVKLHVDSFIKTEGYFPKLILLENHGVIACGSSIKECTIITDICEKAAEVYIKSLGIGNVHFLSEEQVVDLVQDEKEKYRLEQL